MKLSFSVTVLGTTTSFLCFSSTATAAEIPPLDLSEEVLVTSLIAANLSSIAYDDPSLYVSETSDTGFAHPDFDWIKFYTDEPDQAIVAKSSQNGLCYLAFRGTNANFDDWSQNAGLGSFDVFRDNNETAYPGESCEVRGGFADFLATEPAGEGLDDLEGCIASCDDPTNCLVITGHSQGGAASAIAAVTLFRHSPTIITFGQPPTMDAGCPYILSDKYYRYVNSVEYDKDIGFDLVVFAPNWVSRSEHYGYYIMLSEDPTGVNYLGFDTNYTFWPGLTDNDANAHSISGESYSYETRIANLLANTPVNTDGFAAGNVCKDEYNDLCQSEKCVEFACLPVGGITELCVYNSCETDDDCAGDNVCIWDACAAGPGLVEEGCSCFSDEDCVSEDCITINAFALDYRCARCLTCDLPELNLTEEVLTTSLIAANLSSIAYDDPSLWTDTDSDTGFAHPDFDTITFYTDEPDQAILATKNGLCFLAFRGTNANFDDWSQNAGLGNINVFRDNDMNATDDFCEARGGFADFLATEPAGQGLADLEGCLAACELDDCLVITGHSQGGAASAIAAVTLYRHNPTVITFGQPPTMDAGCPYIISDKYYRYVNSIGYENDMGFDLVVFAPNWISKSEHYGYYIMLSDDPGAVAYLGFDTNYTFFPGINDNDANAHSMSGEEYSYETRIAHLLNNFPDVGTDGFEEGNICKADYDELCESGLCVEEKCLPVGGVQELCVYDSCEKDEDCAGDNVCIYDACAAGPGKVEDGCSCFNNKDCLSGDCETVNLVRADFRCAVTKTSANSGAFDPTSRALSWILSIIAAGLLCTLLP